MHIWIYEIYYGKTEMEGNLPIQIPYKLGHQTMLPQIGMPNMTYEEFIANAIRSRRNSRIQILKELGYNSDLLDLIE